MNATPWNSLVLTLALLAAGPTAGPAAAAEPLEGATVEQIIDILHEKGLIDDSEQERLRVKHAAEQQKQQVPGVAARLTDGWDWFGDMRLRHETFRYRHDPFGNDPDNRYRFRYRLRLGFEKALSDRLTLGMRLATGGTPSSSPTRSANQTLGRQEDFDQDSLRVDRAYVRWRLPEYGAMRTTLVGGKFANPLRWSHGQDRLFWDADTQPEGGALLMSYPVAERSRIFSTLVYFIDDEQSQGSDPKLLAWQVGGETERGGVRMGLRGSLYQWRALDQDFIDRAVSTGNLPLAYSRDNAHVGGLALFLGTDLSERWPALLYAYATHNFSADDGVCGLADANGDLTPDGVDCAGGAVLPGTLAAVGEEDTAWMAGIELGHARKLFKLGFGYYRKEANAVVSTFTDSGFLDGLTNRRGWIVYGARGLSAASEFRFAYLSTDYVDDDAPMYFSASSSEYVRIQADLLFKF